MLSIKSNSFPRTSLTPRPIRRLTPVRASAVDDVIKGGTSLSYSCLLFSHIRVTAGVLRIFSPPPERSAPIVSSSFVGEKRQRSSRAATRGKPDLSSPVSKISTTSAEKGESNNIVTFLGTLITRNFTSDDTEPQTWPENSYKGAKKGAKRAGKKPFSDGWAGKK